jgi:hypothetical protein
MFNILLASLTSFSFSCEDLNKIVSNINNNKDLSFQLKEELIVEIVKFKPKNCMIK